MKCVGAEDGSQPCQRCRRTGVESVLISSRRGIISLKSSRCVFERHRRGRKPGSKLVFCCSLHEGFSSETIFRLSEASKMLRRLEKGLNNAKLKSQTLESSSSSISPTDWRTQRGDNDARSPGNYTSDLPPLNLPSQFDRDDQPDRKARPPTDEEDNESEGKTDGMFPVDLIRRENQRNSFFKTILNPSHEAPTSLRSDRSNSTASSQAANPSVPQSLKDPIAAGILDESNAKVLFDLIFLRLNPFVNLFDPALHTPDYVRSKSPFLFTVLIMAGCKFFKPESFKACQKLSYEFAVRAFAENWKSVEVVQAFSCLTYWKEPEDTVSATTCILGNFSHMPQRTWMYIGLVRGFHAIIRSTDNGNLYV
jgi:hypothetical protein